MWEKGNVFSSPGSGGSTFKVKRKRNGGGSEKLFGVCVTGAARDRERERKEPNTLALPAQPR